MVLLQQGQTSQPLRGGKEVVMVDFAIDRLGGMMVDEMTYTPHASRLTAVSL